MGIWIANKLFTVQMPHNSVVCKTAFEYKTKLSAIQITIRVTYHSGLDHLKNGQVVIQIPTELGSPLYNALIFRPHPSSDVLKTSLDRFIKNYV